MGTLTQQVCVMVLLRGPHHTMLGGQSPGAPFFLRMVVLEKAPHLLSCGVGPLGIAGISRMQDAVDH